MATNVGNLAFIVSSQYDNAGIATATVNINDLAKAVVKLGVPFDELQGKMNLVENKLKDVTASSKMIAGMTAVSPHTDPLMAKLGASNNAAIALASGDREYWLERARLRDQDAADAASNHVIEQQEAQRAAVAITASDRAVWTERARLRDQDAADLASSNAIAQQEARVAAAAITASDRAVWLERARLRDQDVKDEIQANNIATQDAKRASNEKAIADEAAWKQTLARKSAAMLNAASAGPGGLDAMQLTGFQMSDREYWLERARLRDKDLADQIQADKLAHINRMNDAAAYTKNILSTVRQQQAAVMQSRKDEGESLRWSLMTEKQRFALRKQADNDHITMLERANALTAQEAGRLREKAGTLGIGSVPGDNNRNNRGFQGAMMVQQLGFGLQDFSSQIMNSKNGIDGIGRGIMAVSNNVQMLGAAFGPTGLAVTAIGGAVAGIILPRAIEWYFKTEETEKALQKVKERYDDIRDSLRQAVAEATQLAEKVAPKDAPRLLEHNRDIAKQDYQTARDRVLKLEGERQRLQKEADRRANLSPLGPTVGAQMLPPQLRARIAGNKDELATAKEEASDLLMQLNATQAAMAQGRRVAQEKADKEEYKKRADAQEKDLKDREKKEIEYLHQGRALKRAAVEEEMRDKQDALEENSKAQQALRDAGLTPSGSSSASIRGTAAAASAINRAVSGTKSEESTNQKQLKELEKINRTLQDQLKQAGLRKASLPA